jgi:cell division transport system permease protein
MHFKTSLDYIKRSPFQALAAISVLTLTFFVATVICLLVYSSNRLLSYFETRPQIIAFLKDEASAENVAALESKLKNDPRVVDVNFVSKEKALEIYKEATADNPLLAELVSPSIFPASLEFSVADLKFAQALTDEVKAEGAVESVGFTASLGSQENLSAVVERLRRATTYIRIGGVAVALILGATSFLVLLVVIGMRLATRRSEIETLSLIGATRGFIKMPIVFEALNYAAIGVFLGWFLAVILILYITPTLFRFFENIPILPHNTLNFLALLGVILAGEFIIGIVIALWGSSIAVGRALRK